MTTDPTHSNAVVDTELGSPASSASPTADHAADHTTDPTARLNAVERTITNDDADFSSFEDLTAIERRVTELESAVESLIDHLDEMSTATQTIRDYLGDVRAVNEDIERRTNATLVRAESLESELVSETASPAPSRPTDVPISEAASHTGRITDGDNGSDSRRTAETGLGTGTAAPPPESRTTPDSGAPTDSRGDSAGHGLAAHLHDAL